MRIDKLKTPQGTMRIAASYDNEPVTPERIAAMAAGLPVDGVVLRSAELTAMKATGLGWLAELEPLRMLELLGKDRTSIPPVPQSVLNHLEIFSQTGRRQAIRTEDLGQLKELWLFPASALEGSLSRCADLRRLHLEDFAAADLAILDECSKLDFARFGGIGQVVSFGWETPPTSLQFLMLESIACNSLDGLEQLTDLHSLYIYAPRGWAGTLDLTPLAACTGLVRVYVRNFQSVRGAAAMRQLPRLEALGFEGVRLADDFAGLPVSSAPAP